ncbi:MAG: glycosyltransferase [Pirellula sp.]
MSFIRSFSVVVPVFNKQAAIVRTLESVIASVNFFAEHFQEYPVQPEIVVVDDCSTDQSRHIISEFSKRYSFIKTVFHSERTHAGIARNSGVRSSQGEIIFFCDGDDVFFREHILLCYLVLNYDPSEPKSREFTFPTNGGPMSFELPEFRFGLVRTGVYIQDSILPTWKAVIEATIPQNLCVRRECHEFVGGFPEQSVPFRLSGGGEDCCYSAWLDFAFRKAQVQIETVEYIRYPGNALDAQLRRFQSEQEGIPYSRTQTAMDLDKQALDICKEHLERLKTKLRSKHLYPELASFFLDRSSTN